MKGNLWQFYTEVFDPVDPLGVAFRISSQSPWNFLVWHSLTRWSTVCTVCGITITLRNVRLSFPICTTYPYILTCVVLIQFRRRHVFLDIFIPGSRFVGLILILVISPCREKKIESRCSWIDLLKCLLLISILTPDLLATCVPFLKFISRWFKNL